jgi:iron(III) transport system substrate-binding protein
MTRHASLLLLLAGSVLNLIGLASCRARSSSDAPTREVVVYCSVDQDVAEPILAEFTRQSGIKVLARYDTEASKTSGLVQRLRAESASPLADLFWSADVFYSIRLARDGLLTPLPRSDATTRPAWADDPAGRWRGFAARQRVLAFHTGRVPADQAPRTLEDLLDAKWKGRLVMARPQFGTTGSDLASWFAHYGHDRAKEILRGLAANRIAQVDGNSVVVRMIATGQADVGLTDTDDVYNGQRNGWPVAMNPLDQGGAGALTIPNAASLVRGGPHQDEARELAAFLLSPRVETLLAESDMHASPLHPAVAADPKFAKYAIVKPLAIDFTQVADQLPEAIRAAGEILP